MTAKYEQFFHPLVADEKLTVTDREVNGMNGDIAYITVQSPSGKRVTLAYGMRTKEFMGPV